MIGLILATCITVSPDCGKPDTIKFDIIDAFNTRVQCDLAFRKEPEWRRKLLTCDEITPVDEDGKDLPLPPR